jgi:hypothetical protein
MRILGLIISLGLVLYLTSSLINRQVAPEKSDKNLLNKPAEVRTQINNALDLTEKARQKALDESK